jgi:glycine/D-amino acid oxidase-like deaminating enzyme
VAQPEVVAGPGVVARDAAGAVVGHHPLDAHAARREPGDRAPQKGRCGLAALIGQDLDIGQGPLLDPDEELTAPGQTEGSTRAYLRERFPSLERAPLLSVRACRYELTVDTHFIAAQHPEHPSVWLVAGGSGHGFKHGPALAERLVAAFAGEPLPKRFALGDRVPGRSMRTAGSGLAN